MFAFTDEQRALADTARDWLAAHHDDDRPDRVWTEIKALGWLDGLDMVALGRIAEETGAALFGHPLLSTVGLAAPQLCAAGLALDVPTTVAEVDDDGRAGRVPDADRVERVLAIRAGRVYAADIVSVTPDSASEDPSRPWFDVVCDVGDDLGPAVDTTDRWRALTACELVGVARYALDVAVAYAGLRIQFGRPIGANQAIAHPLVDRYADIELARSLSYRAAWCVEEQTDDASSAAAVAAIAARATAMRTCETAMQTLGAMGVARAHPMRLAYGRASQADWRPAALRAEVAQYVFDEQNDTHD